MTTPERVEVEAALNEYCDVIGDINQAGFHSRPTEIRPARRAVLAIFERIVQERDAAVERADFQARRFEDVINDEHRPHAALLRDLDRLRAERDAALRGDMYRAGVEAAAALVEESGTEVGNMTARVIRGLCCQPVDSTVNDELRALRAEVAALTAERDEMIRQNQRLIDVARVCQSQTERVTADNERLTAELARRIGTNHPNYRHGHSGRGSIEYARWSSMVSRCTNPKNKFFAHYGGRGIGVCPEWRDFAVFLADMGPQPGPGYTLDRINNDGGYGPDNCRWADGRTQRKNRNDVVLIEIDGETLCVTEWAERSGVSRRTIKSRYDMGIRGPTLLLPAHAALAPRETEVEA